MTKALTHIDADGAARMVNVADKPETPRLAIASGRIRMAVDALAAVRAGDAPKGDVLGTARIAGIMAAKRTADLIPMCHPLMIDAVDIAFDFEPDGVRVDATVSLTGKTGVEMEAMTAACVALLTIYDMAKALDKSMVIDAVRLVEKRGGKSECGKPKVGKLDGSAKREPMLLLEEAQARLLALAVPLDKESVEVESTVGFYLSEPLLARRTQPAHDLSAMDGYAVQGDNLSGPWRVVGESAAGHPFEGAFAVGEAVRISTGAVLPAGTTAVILQEDMHRQGDRLTLTGEPPAPPCKHIRRRGMDFAIGQQIMAGGELIGPAQQALAVSAGYGQLPVRRRARVVVIDSGDELAADPETCEAHQIPASNGIMLLAMIRALPVDARRIGPVADDLSAITAALAASADADVIVTSGGASVGEHDLIRPALHAWGATLEFWRVAIKPGKPILVAVRNCEDTGRTQIVLGLPGNPVSSFVTAYHFLLPLLRHMLGAGEPIPRSFPVRLAASLRANGPRREFLRAYWDGDTVMPNPLQDSGALSSLAASNMLIDRPAFAPTATPGDIVSGYLIQTGGIA